jgi:uncharacterized membrane protein YeaQ/YmgE (transglycosylase-associated protein family)
MVERRMNDVLIFVIHGFLGALLATWLWAKSFKDLYSFEAVRNYIVGLIIGYVYSLLHSQYNFPNAVMSIVAGYFGKDFIEAVFERLKSFKR